MPTPLPDVAAFAWADVAVLGCGLVLLGWLAWQDRDAAAAKIYLPLTRTAARSPVAQHLGTDLMIALATAGLPRRIPTAKPWLARVFRSDDLRVSEIAWKLHVTDVTVRKWLRVVDGLQRADDRPLPLF